MNKRFIVFLSSRKSWTLPYIIFSAIFVIIPLFLIVVYAFTDDSGHLTLANFQKFFEHPEAINTFVYSIGIAIITTLVCILLGYPAAWILSNSKLNRSKTMVVLFILPMWVNILVRTLATVALFDFFSVPLGEGALIFGMVYNFIPFMIYPIYNTLQKMDHSYIEAAQDLGANPVQVFLKAVLPLSMPGVMSGIMMVFMPTISTFAIAELLTMNNIKLFGTTIQENINNSMWNYGASLSLIMLLLKARSRKAIGFVNSIPILNGDIITGISLFLLFVSLGITQGYTTVVLAHITFCTPYVVLSVLPRLKQMNPNIYEAALDLGATPMQALWKVIIPEIRPGMISGFMLALTLSIDDFAVTVFTIGNQGLETLSTYIYADARKGGLTPELRPLSAIIFVVVLALLVVINYRAGKTKKKD